MVNGPENSSAHQDGLPVTVAVNSHSPSTPAYPMSSRDWAPAGVARAPSTIGTRNALTTRFPCTSPRPSVILQECARVSNLGAGIVRITGNRDDLPVIFASLGPVTGPIGGLRCAYVGTQPVGLLLQGGFKVGECLLWHVALKQHGTVQFTRGPGSARRHRVLFGFVLGVGCGAHGPERVVVLALGIQHPGGGHLHLNIDLFGPISVFGLTQLIAQLGELRDVGPGGFRTARAGGAECARE